MVYDPIRDRDVPSPATTLPPRRETWKQTDSPGSSFSSVGEDARGAPNGRSHPPAFSDDRRSPIASSSPSSGGLRGLLNEEGEPRRRSGEQRSSVSATFEEGRARPSFHQLLNDPAPPVSKSNSSTSLAHSSSPSNLSPGTRHRGLDPNAFLTPGTPASMQPRANPTPQYPVGASPGTAPTSLPYTDPSYASYYATPQAGPSTRRQSVDTSHRPMLPPQELPPQYYDYSTRMTPGTTSLPLRSPSVSISPRTYHTSLPAGYGGSGPSSSTSASQPFPYQPPALPSVSPASSSRRLSEDRGHPPISDPYQNSRRGTVPQRRPTQVTLVYSPSYPSVRSPSPIRRTMYNPRRISQPSSVLRPIDHGEVAHLRSLALTNNPLRRRKKRPLPSWSGPSPGGRETPMESNSSYFPLQDGAGPSSGHRRSASHIDRRGSVSSSTGRPSVTPGGPGYPPAFDERRSITPGGTQVSSMSQIRGNTSGHGEMNHRKRASEREDDEHDATRRKVSETAYVSNAEAIAYHCKLATFYPSPADFHRQRSTRGWCSESRAISHNRFEEVQQLDQIGSHRQIRFSSAGCTGCERSRYRLWERRGFE